MQIFANTNYDLLKWRHRVTALFLAIMAVGAIFLFQRGLNLGIDFSGGANVVLRFTGPVPINDLRAELPRATIQQYGPAEENSILIRLPQQEREGDYAGQIVTTLHGKMNPEAASKHDINFLGRDRLAGLLRDADPDRRGTNAAAQQHYNDLAARIIEKRSELGIFTEMRQVTSVPGVTTASAAVLNEKAFLGRFNLLSQETVGPQVGKELQSKAIWAIVLATLAMGVYIAVRFDMKFGVAAIIGLIVDVAVTFAVVAIARLEFSLITVSSFLMIIGYSINDKVVIYDRVRENLRKSRGEDFNSILNRSLNQTLSRTVLTGGCVLLILLSLTFLGGEVLRDFALLLFIGTVVGTITTLTVVPAVVMAWNSRNAGKPPSAEVRRETPARVEPARRRRAS